MTKVIIEIVFSHDDLGYYATVIDHDGRDLHATQVFYSVGQAARAAREWTHHNDCLVTFTTTV